MGNSPGRVARPICLIMALLLFAATVFALVIGASQRGEQATIGLQAAFTLAILAVLWVLIGIMFSLPRPDHEEPQPEQPQHPAPPSEPRVNWFQDPKGVTVGAMRRRQTGNS